MDHFKKDKFIVNVELEGLVVAIPLGSRRDGGTESPDRVLGAGGQSEFRRDGNTSRPNDWTYMSHFGVIADACCFRSKKRGVRHESLACPDEFLWPDDSG